MATYTTWTPPAHNMVTTYTHMHTSWYWNKIKTHLILHVYTKVCFSKVCNTFLLDKISSTVGTYFHGWSSIHQSILLLLFILLHLWLWNLSCALLLTHFYPWRHWVRNSLSITYLIITWELHSYFVTTSITPFQNAHCLINNKHVMIFSYFVQYTWFIT